MADYVLVEKLSLAPKPIDSDSDSVSNSGFHTPPAEQESALTSVAQSSISSGEDIDQLKGPIRTPFTRPLPECKPIARPGLTAEQAGKYADLHATVTSWQKGIPTSTARNATTEPLTHNECIWLSRECLLRYLRASSWSPTEAPKRLMNTLVWRREFNVDGITADHVSIESETGKQHILGYDINARPCLFMNPGKQNTKKSERQIQHVVFMLERVIDMSPAGQETTALLINFRNSSTGGSPSIGQGKEVLTILQSHYPERLGRACISDCKCFGKFAATISLTSTSVPWYITTFFKLISPFIDPVTKEKMIFNQSLRQHVPPSQLDKEYGGDADFEYVHSIYWPALNKICAERRAAQKERWIRGGKQLGEYEGYLKGGDQKSLREHTNGAGSEKGALPVDSSNQSAPPRKVGE